MEINELMETENQDVFHPPMQYPTAPIILHSNVQPAAAFAPPAVGPKSTRVTCPHCRSQVSTEVSYRSTTRTHISCLVLAICCCWLCCWLPYCMNTCRNANHFCPMCRNYIGTYQS